MKKIKYIRFSFPKKEEKIENLSLKVSSTLDLLKIVNSNYFENWFEQASSRKTALQKKIDENINFIQAIISKEWDKKFIELGSNFSFWTGKSEDENFQISFIIGVTSQNKYIKNNICLSFPQDFNSQKELNENCIKILCDGFEKIWKFQEIEIIR